MPVSVWTEEMLASAKRMRTLEAKTYVEIAKILGVKKEAVRYELQKKAGVSLTSEQTAAKNRMNGARAGTARFKEDDTPIGCSEQRSWVEAAKSSNRLFLGRLAAVFPQHFRAP